MASSEENVTSSPGPKTSEVQAAQLSPDGFEPRPGIHRRTSILLSAAVLAALLWKPFVRLHSRLQIALFETLDEKPDKKRW